MYSLQTWRCRVRVSISYLYRIRVDNEYMLIKGKRFEQFQPVGGVYKFHPSSLGMRTQLDVRDDELLAPDQISDQDLRVRVKGKHLLAFIRWFEKGIGRETDGWREFYEELVASGILPEQEFRSVRYDRIRRHYEPMRFSEWARSKEILIADIFELLPSPQQLEALKELRVAEHPEILWATESQIQRNGVVVGSSSQTTTIARTASWTLGGGK
ncbi:SMODS-associated NUDIX domain-containing protein [Arthrobacter sp. TMN-49]